MSLPALPNQVKEVPATKWMVNMPGLQVWDGREGEIITVLSSQDHLQTYNELSETQFSHVFNFLYLRGLSFSRSFSVLVCAWSQSWGGLKRCVRMSREAVWAVPLDLLNLSNSQAKKQNVSRSSFGPSVLSLLSFLLCSALFCSLPSWCLSTKLWAQRSSLSSSRRSTQTTRRW